MYLLLWERIPWKKWSSLQSQQVLARSTWMQSQKRQNDLSSFQRKALNTTVMQVYAPAINVEEGEAEQFYEDLQYLLEQTPK